KGSTFSLSLDFRSYFLLFFQLWAIRINTNLAAIILASFELMCDFIKPQGVTRGKLAVVCFCVKRAAVIRLRKCYVSFTGYIAYPRPIRIRTKGIRQIF